MKVQTRFLLSAAVLLVLTSAAFSREIKVDYDHHANFSQYKTYSWGKVETQNPLWDDRVKEAVDRELAKKGWTEVASGGDVTVMAIGTTRDQPTLQTFYDGFPGWRWGGFGEATTWVEHYEVGTLIIDMFDSRDKKLIWRGSASGFGEKPKATAAWAGGSASAGVWFAAAQTGLPRHSVEKSCRITEFPPSEAVTLRRRSIQRRQNCEL